MKFELDDFHRNISDDELLNDLKKVAHKLCKDSISFREYNKHGKYSSGTFGSRFGSWNKCLEMAGLKSTKFKNIPEEALLKNIEDIWIKLGRQPRSREFADRSLSKYSAATYAERFGSFRKALAAFVEYINDDQLDDKKVKPNKTTEPLHNIDSKKNRKRTKREISERLRFSILLRDGFRCQSCGRSPIKSPGVELHVDHILPWEQGGETTRENLQTKCKECNLGKGNAFDK